MKIKSLKFKNKYKTWNQKRWKMNYCRIRQMKNEDKVLQIPWSKISFAHLKQGGELSVEKEWGWNLEKRTEWSPETLPLWEEECISTFYLFFTFWPFCLLFRIWMICQTGNFPPWEGVVTRLDSELELNDTTMTMHFEAVTILLDSQGNLLCQHP